MKHIRSEEVHPNFVLVSQMEAVADKVGEITALSSKSLLTKKFELCVFKHHESAKKNNIFFSFSCLSQIR